jgi:hypothetical protein
LIDRILGLYVPRLERDNDRLGIADVDRQLGQADQLNGTHALSNQHAGKIGGAGEVIRDAT